MLQRFLYPYTRHLKNRLEAAREALVKEVSARVIDALTPEVREVLTEVVRREIVPAFRYEMNRERARAIEVEVERRYQAMVDATYRQRVAIPIDSLRPQGQAVERQVSSDWLDRMHSRLFDADGNAIPAERVGVTLDAPQGQAVERQVSIDSSGRALYAGRRPTFLSDEFLESPPEAPDSNAWDKLIGE
jgi:hypothetical protein